MQNFQDTLETCKRPFISAFSICMTVPVSALMFICLPKINFISRFFSEILQTWYFRYFGHTWLWSVKWYYQPVEKLWYLSSCKKIIYLTTFLKYYLQTYTYKACHFGYFGHARLATPTKCNSTVLFKTLIFISKQKINLSLIFLKKYIGYLIDQEHFAQ